jgi:hypothetical protein
MTKSSNPHPEDTRAPSRLGGLLFLLLGATLFAGLGFSYERSSNVAMADFKPLYYGARCLLTGCDLYSQQQLQHLYFSESEDQPYDKIRLANNVIWSYYPPTAYMLVAPIAALPWRPAHLLWMTLTCATFLLAAFLIWELGSRSRPLACGLLVCLFLIGQELLVEVGNASGLVVALCLIAVWCFLRRRFELAGVLCLALGLAIKPHDAGPIWLYFLIAGGPFRKRALQTLLCAIVLSLPAVLWVQHLGPDWLPELRHNLAATAAPGAINDPGPSGFEPRAHGAIVVSLQSVISIYRDNPHFYNPLSYLICGLMLVVWLMIGLRSRFPRSLAPLALASVAVLSILPVYHRQHDLGLLLLTVPACTLLLSNSRRIGAYAVFITASAAILLSNQTIQFLAIVAAFIRATTHGLTGQVLALLLSRPAPIVLLAVAAFYLWAYSVEARILRNSPQSTAAPVTLSSAERAVATGI